MQDRPAFGYILSPHLATLGHHQRPDDGESQADPAGLVLKKNSNSFGRLSALIPQPRSLTVMAALWPCDPPSPR